MTAWEIMLEERVTVPLRLEFQDSAKTTATPHL